MNEIELLIDRYLAEGLEPDELAALSEAVRRTDAPEEWRTVRYMIDALSEGEEDYDLFVAARPAVPKRFRLKSAWLWRAAAAVVLIAGVGISLYINRGATLELAQTTTDSIRQHVAQQQQHVAEEIRVVPAETAVIADAPKAEEADENEAKESVSSKPETPEECPVVPSVAAEEVAVSKQYAEVAVVDQRRIYSNNLLDEIPE